MHYALQKKRWNMEMRKTGSNDARRIVWAMGGSFFAFFDTN